MMQEKAEKTGRDIEDPARAARQMVRRAVRAGLCSLLPAGKICATPDRSSPDLPVWPWCSLVLMATDVGGAPLLLLSDLAEHSSALKERPDGSLMIEECRDHENPLSGARLTLAGRFDLLTGEKAELARLRYEKRYPSSVMYRQFADFRLWRMTIHRAHYIGGFARARWLSADSLQIPGFAKIADAWTDAGSERPDTGGDNSGSERDIPGLDPEGMDFRLPSGELDRIVFPEIAETPAQGLEMAGRFGMRAGPR